MAQYNGDLLDRITEVPVEPWDNLDFLKVINKGEKELGIKFSTQIIDAVCTESFGSIGVVQELLKCICLNEHVLERRTVLQEITSLKSLGDAITQKTNDYAARHVRALEDIAVGRKSTTDETSLYLPYYFVTSILRIDFPNVVRGIERKKIEDDIKTRHHRADGVRQSDLNNLLYNLTNMQVKKNIVPPIFDFDRGQRLVKVIDSTFYFFLKHCDNAELLENIPMPAILAE